MILVDSSVWIDYFLDQDTPQVEILDKSLGVRAVGIGDLVLTEVLQGFRADKDYRLDLELIGILPRPSRLCVSWHQQTPR